MLEGGPVSTPASNTVDAAAQQVTPEQHLTRLARTVERLARPHTITTRQSSGTGLRIERIVWHPPLIAQLRNAAGSTTGGGGGGAGPNARNAIDADALEQYDTIRKAIAYAFEAVKVPHPPMSPRALPEQQLAYWHTLFTLTISAGLNDPDDDDLEFYTRKWSGWAHLIDKKFDPPTKLESTLPCPICGERWHTHPDTGDRQPAIEITFTGRVDHSYAACAACGERWAGKAELQLLAHLQELTQ
jgi:hypothetical protein